MQASRRASPAAGPPARRLGIPWNARPPGCSCSKPSWWLCGFELLSEVCTKTARPPFLGLAKTVRQVPWGLDVKPPTTIAAEP